MNRRQLMKAALGFVALLAIPVSLKAKLVQQEDPIERQARQVVQDRLKQEVSLLGPSIGSIVAQEDINVFACLSERGGNSTDAKVYRMASNRFHEFAGDFYKSLRRAKFTA